MFKAVGPESIAAQQRAIEDAKKVEELVKHPGWEVVMRIVGTLLEAERRKLSGQKVDEGYAKKIGFLQSLQYFKLLPQVLSNKEVFRIVLAQGRALGLETIQQVPQYVFDGRRFAQDQIASWAGTAKPEDKKQYMEQQLQ